MLRVIGLISLAMLQIACSDDDAGLLVVDLRTDYVSGEEFEIVRTELFSVVEDVEGTPLATEDAPATFDQRFIDGERVAELSLVGSGTAVLRTLLLRQDESSVAERITRVALRGSNTGVTVLVTRDCAGLVCPGAGDPADAIACLGGRCVAPDCAEEAPEACGVPDCMTDADCGAPTATCATARCVAGACLQDADAGACGMNEWCDPGSDCRLRASFDPCAAPTPVAANELLARAAEYVCERVLEDSDSFFDEAVIRGRDECVSRVSHSIASPSRGWVHAISQIGTTIDYDGVAAARCLLDCDGAVPVRYYEAEEVVFGRAGACQDMLVGNVVAGGVCRHDAECVGDAFCNATNPTTCGTCEPRVALGAACTRNGECSRDPAGFTSCAGITCRTTASQEPRPGLGEPCGIEMMGDLFLERRCARGLYCDVAACAARVPVGSPCTFDAQCEAGSVCPAGTCVARTEALLGGTCGDTAMVSARCDLPGTTCNVTACECTMTCPAGCGEFYGGVGAPCGGCGNCALDLRCDGTTNECAPLLPMGSACTFSGQCESGLCDGVTCVAEYCPFVVTA